jgi:hypothetical protein
MAIKGLPGYMWVYPGKKDPASGQVATTRYAVNPATGDRLTYRQAYTKAHGGVPHEKRVPKEKRKQYKKKPAKQYTKKGTFKTIDGLVEGLRALKPGDVGYVMVRGKLIPGTSPKLDKQSEKKKRKSVYANVTTITDMATLANIFDRISRREPSTKFQDQIEHNLRNFSEIQSFTIWKRK